MDTILELKQIRKSFYGVDVLQGIDFQLQQGEIHALCGENGAGKSTLMKIIAGIYTKDSGQMFFQGRELHEFTPLAMQNLGISVIHQELNLLEDLTVAQNLFFGREPLTPLGFIDERKLRRMTGEQLQNLEPIHPDTKVKQLGVAKKQIVEIAKALSLDARLIIMDEPTAVLTNKETQMLFDLMSRLKQKGVSIIFISHRLNEIRKICDRITILKDGEFVVTKTVAEVADRDIVKWMIGRDIGEMKPKSLGPSPETLKVENIVHKQMLRNISFSLQKGEILGIAGLIGSGRTELAELIFGIRKPDQGEIFICGRKVNIGSPMEAITHKISFATEDRKNNGLLLNRSIRENIGLVKHLLTKGFWVDVPGESAQALDYADKFNLKYTSLDAPVVNLSGGNQQKVVLAKWMLADADIFILDEPTRGVDVGARADIYQQINRLAGAGKSVIVISSDLAEILGLCHRILVMREGGIVGELHSDEATEENIMMLATGVREEVRI